MTQPKISFVYLTYRPGGIDLLVSSFNEARDDYELIVVDDYPGRVQRGKSLQFFKEKNIPVTWYGPSKPRSAPTKCGIVNAMNTGLLHVNSSYVVFLQDFHFYLGTWIEGWVKTFTDPEYLKELEVTKDKFLVTGVAIVYHANKPEKEDDIFTWSSGASIRPKWPWVPKEFELFYAGGPMEFFEKINGLDERADHCGAWIVKSCVAQAKMLGYELKVADWMVAHVVDHRVWSGIVAGEGPDNLWKINSWRSVLNEPNWSLVPSPNKFNLKERKS